MIYVCLFVESFIPDWNYVQHSSYLLINCTKVSNTRVHILPNRSCIENKVLSNRVNNSECKIININRVKGKLQQITSYYLCKLKKIYISREQSTNGTFWTTQPNWLQLYFVVFNTATIRSHAVCSRPKNSVSTATEEHVSQHWVILSHLWLAIFCPTK